MQYVLSVLLQALAVPVGSGVNVYERNTWRCLHVIKEEKYQSVMRERERERWEKERERERERGEKRCGQLI